jgi:RNA polymerase sigma-70 factor, ECF subfamily
LVKKPDPTNHAALIATIANSKDPTAYSTLFAYFAPRLNAYFLRGGLESAIAEEMTQDVMIAVWRKAHQYDPARATASAWIYGIASNLRIDRLRRNRLVLPDGDLSDQRPDLPLPDAIVEADDTAKRLRDAIADLPADQLSALHLAFFADRSHAEIQSILNIPLGTIKSRLRLALTKLRGALKDFE